MLMHSLLRRACAGVVALLLVAGPAAAQSPPVRIVVGGPAGGNTDIAARLVSDRLAQILGTAVIVENKPGAGGTIAAEVVRNAKPDGLTIGLVTASNAANETLIPNKSYRLLTDLEPLGLYAWLANVLIVNPEIKGATVNELVDHAQGRARARTTRRAASAARAICRAKRSSCARAWR